MIAAPAAEAVAGRAAASTAAKQAAKQTAAKQAGTETASKSAAGTGAGRTAKPAAAGPAGGPPPPPEQATSSGDTASMAADLMKPPGKKAIKNAGKSAGDAFKSATLTPPRRLSAKDTSGFLFGLVLYAVALSGIKYGVDGPKGWLSAKFLNKPMGFPKMAGKVK